MKVFFADDIDNLVAELVAQAVKSVRMHVMRKLAGESVVLQLYITAYCNNMIYEGIATEKHSVKGVAADKLLAFVEEKAATFRETFAKERFRRFEIKAGIYQD
jgi:hypothetical protein